MSKKISAAILGVLLILVTTELITRIVGYCPVVKQKRYMIFSTDKGFSIYNGVIPSNHFIFSRDPYLFWKLKRVTEDKFHAVNLQGFRGKVITLKKSPDTFRIFCIGDSCTFGLHVEYYEAYPFVLESLLNKNTHKLKYEVINAGVLGYSSLQGLRHLEKDILKYKPDLVIASFGWNDTFDALGYTDKQQRTPSKVELLVYSILSNSKAYLALEDLISDLISKIKFGHNHVTTNGNVLVRVPGEDFLENLAKMYKLGRAHNFKVILVNQPSRISQPHRYSDLIKKFSEENNVMFLDLEERLVSTNIAPTELFMDHNHPTILGHRIIAESIFEFMKNKGMF